MLNAQKLLGGLLKQSLKQGRRRKRRRSRSSVLGNLTGGLGGAAGMGILGIAIAAYEHFTKKESPAAAGPPAGSGASPSPPAPPPPPQASSSSRPMPPPLPAGASPARQILDSMPEVGIRPAPDQDALVLIRAMIAAANADGHIDEEEKGAILERLAEASITQEEETFIRRELESPPSIDSLLPGIQTPEMAQQVYAVSLLAIEVDTQAERDYLAYLKIRLKLEDQVVAELHRQFDGVDGEERASSGRKAPGL